MPDALPAPTEGEVLIFASPDCAAKVDVICSAETFWLTQKRTAKLFGVDVRTVSEHLGNIYATGELRPETTLWQFRTVRQAGSRQVARDLDHCNVDAVISVGYRVNSRQATQAATAANTDPMLMSSITG
ncbi:MAG: virulence RhuM family protein [Actinobacteria bacterium]|nr:virulence RhuM family protein [Actinomycetota bacterium]